METDERVYLNYEQAAAMLPDGDTIHAFRNSGGILVGADWDRASVLEALRTGRPELAGEQATSMDHGLVAWDEHGPVFFETKKGE